MCQLPISLSRNPFWQTNPPRNLHQHLATNYSSTSTHQGPTWQSPKIKQDQRPSHDRMLWHKASWTYDSRRSSADVRASDCWKNLVLLTNKLTQHMWTNQNMPTLHTWHWTHKNSASNWTVVLRSHGSDRFFANLQELSDLHDWDPTLTNLPDTKSTASLISSWP